MTTTPEERHIRRLLARRVAMHGAYYDDGEAQGEEHGIWIDFLRESAADIEKKLKALNVARFEASRADVQAAVASLLASTEAPAEDPCTFCNGRRVVGIPGAPCSWCNGKGTRPSRSHFE